jgi:hypothetical protein
VALGVWRHPLQRPGLLLARQSDEPWPDWRTLAAAEREQEKENGRWQGVQDAVRILERAAESIRREALQLLREHDAGEGVAAAAGRDPDPAAALFKTDQEQLASGGGRGWQQVVLVRDGTPARELRDPLVARRLPALLRALGEIAALPGQPMEQLPRGSVEISTLRAGTVVQPHCGPSNHRLRLHLGLSVPGEGGGGEGGEEAEPEPGPGAGDGDSHGDEVSKGTEEKEQEQDGAALVVAGEMRRWVQGEVLVFDDSFEHEVWNKNRFGRSRTVLILDMWHPEVSARQRAEARAKIPPELQAAAGLVTRA